MTHPNQIISTIIAAIAVIALLKTNPKEQEFREYIEQNLRTEAVQEGGLGGAIMELISEPQAWLMTLDTKRTNFYLFSVYSVTGLDKEKKYVGVFNTFFELPN